MKSLFIILLCWLISTPILLRSQSIIQSDSVKSVGHIENGLKSGSWVYYDSNTNNVKQVCVYQNGQLNGTCYLFENNVLTIKISFSSGIINGKVHFYSKEGDILAIYKYINGIRSEILYYIAGKDSPSRNHIYTPKDKVIY